MIEKPTPRGFVDALAELTLRDCFNPYADRYPPFDLKDAPAIRRANLVHVLEAAAATEVHELWVGLELGHNGGRRTGLAMTDDHNLSAHGLRFKVDDKLQRATHAGPLKELTASVVWAALAPIRCPVFLWNVVPVHPHRPGEPLSNRRHTAAERSQCLPYLDALVALLRPKRIVTVGKDASTALARRSIAHMPVRHPAFGGKRDFMSQIAELTR